ncbi:hypothetical protein [Massilia sp.]|uniref:hypothetical protein n=1 Tax=Massilia sp. TaxID=1882437 RepID=UPI00352C8850
MSSDMDLTSDRFWRQLIRSGGGAKYFVCHAVATAMVYHFSEVSNTVQSRGGDLDVFVNPLLIKLLKKPCSVWTDWYQPIVIALAHTPEPHRENLVVRLDERRKAMHGIYQYARVQCDAAAREVSLLEKQTTTLRKRVTTAETAFAQVQASNRTLQESLKGAAFQTAGSATPEERERAAESYARSLREKDTHLEKLRISLADTTDELARTRELLNVVLEPPPGVTLTPVEVCPSTHPEKWRIVFVGGHQRLHSKLRKQLRNAIFLHPDQSHFSPDVFNGADAVVFSIGYCSHKLTYRSANEVRRRGLRAGYSNFSNVEIVLEEIRAILFPSDGPGRPEGGVTA